MKINALLMDDRDNVVTCVSEVPAGEPVVYQKGSEFLTVTAKDRMNGKLTKAEAYGFSDIAIDHVCRFI